MEMKDYSKIIRSKGLKATPQRVAVYKTMEYLGHATPDMVIDGLRESSLKMTISSVYNVLESFAKVGLLNRLPSQGSKMYFDITTDPHCHIYDKDEQTFSDFEDNKLIEIVEDYISNQSISNFKREGIDIIIKGNTVN
jgi:Fur family transcriptional regulator, peroxide stress response regulator